jgi:hypothetical protein
MGIYFKPIVLLYVSLVFCVVVSKSGQGEEIILASSETRMRDMWTWPQALVAGWLAKDVIAFNDPLDVPKWCGKPYMST